MNLATKIRLILLLKRSSNSIEEGIQMKNSTKIVTALIALVTGIVEIPSIQHAITSYITLHPAVALSATGIASIVALLHTPTKDAE